MQSLNITIALPAAVAVATVTKADTPAATLVAERFKTRLCKTFRKTGECAFLARCMFAHGKDDLRTTEGNVANGLVTEAAVKNWQRATIRADEKAAKQPVAVAAARPVAKVVALAVAEPASPRSVSPSECVIADTILRVVTVTPMAATKPAARTPVRRYRHDPYAQFSAWQPLESASDSAASTPRAPEVVHSSPLSVAMRRATKPAPIVPAPIAGVLMP